MRLGFIILKENNIPVGTVEEFLTGLQKISGDIMIEGIYPGSPIEYYYGFGIN
jgi:hypothetical protein